MRGTGDRQHAEDPQGNPAEHPTERRLFADLRKHLSGIPTAWPILVWTGVLCIVALAGAFPFLTGASRADVVAGVSLVGTLTGLAVALAIFRWTQSDSIATREHITREVLRVLGAAAKASEAADPDDDLATEDGASPPTVGGRYTLHDRAYVVGSALANTADWWADMLRRIRSVANDDSNDAAGAARELLGMGMEAFRWAATLEESQRGNRRTLLITSTDGGSERVWSVYSGRGAHVIDITDDVRLSG